MTWLLLQLADAAFPAGGFAHSAGLEASLCLGGAKEVEAFFRESLWQAGRGALPFVHAAATDPRRLAELDGACDVFLTSHVANRASRAQGRSFASAAGRIFGLGAIAEHARRAHAHHAPIFGAIYGTLGLAAEDAQIAFMHGTARGVLSAAVRLGAIGPLEAQRIHAEHAPLMDDVLAACLSLDIADVAQTSPIIEIYGALHDRLDGHLFQS